MKALFGLLLGILIALGLFNFSKPASDTEPGISGANSTKKFEGVVVDVLAKQHPALIITLSRMNASGLINPTLHPATLERLSDPAAIAPTIVEKKETRAHSRREAISHSLDFDPGF